MKVKYRILYITDFLDQPGGTRQRDLYPNDIVFALGRTSGSLIEVELAGGRQGWISGADCAPDSSSRPAVNRADFVATCLHVETAFNDLTTTPPWYVAADFVIARGLIETNLTNAGPSVGSDAAGPLKVSVAEWKSFLDFLAGADEKPASGQYQEEDYDDWLMQIWGAAYRMYADAKAISAKKTAAGSKDPFVPSYLDLFHAYLAGVEPAVAILDASNSDQDRKRPLADLLKPVMTQAAFDALFPARSRFTGTVTMSRTVAEFVAATEAALDDALKSAFALIKELAPEELPKIKQGEAPWFDVALKAEADHISEVDNPEVIKGYFDATDFGHPNSIVAWCGAFAAHCMKESGSPQAAGSIPKGAAAAVNWKNWGSPLPVRADDVPQGAVVVLSPPPGTDTTGHVGFCVQFLDGGKSIQLLGGNQSHRVQRSTYPASRISAIQWLDLAPDVATAGGASPQPSQMRISQAAFDLIVASEVTSKDVYEMKYRHPEWPGERSGVTIGIGYDVGYASEDQLRADWKDAIPVAMIDALGVAVGIKGPAAQPLAGQLGSVVDVPWDAALQVHRTAVIPRWVAVVQNTLPNTNLLAPDCLGALVSLTFNRGASFGRPEPRYSEMRDIKQHMQARQFTLIPDDFRHMARLWPNSKGLRDRREQEAQLFARGLASMPVA